MVLLPQRVPLLAREEAVSRLLAEVPLVDVVLPQPRERRLAPQGVIPLQVVLLDAGDRVEADLVHALAGALLGVEEVAEQGVYVGRLGHALGQHGQRLALAGGPDAVEDEAARLDVARHDDRGEADAAHLRGEEGEDGRRGLAARHELHHAVPRRDEVVRVEQAGRVGEGALGRHLGRREAAAVGREDAVGREGPLEQGQHGRLERERLGQALDGQPGRLGQLVRADLAVGRLGPRAARRGRCGAQVGGGAYVARVRAALGAVRAEVVRDVLSGRAQRVVRDVVDGHGPRVRRPHERDPPPDVAGAHDQHGPLVQALLLGRVPLGRGRLLLIGSCREGAVLMAPRDERCCRPGPPLGALDARCS